MYRFLLSRQWVTLTLVALLLVPTMIALGIWQMNRYEERSARNQLVTDALAADPVPVERLAAPGHAVTRAERYRTVTATGRFDTDAEVVVRRRTNADEEIGFHVLTPFVLDDGKVLLVNRGWIPADGPSQTEFPKVPARAARRDHDHRPADAGRDDRGQRHQGPRRPAGPADHADQQRAGGGAAGRRRARRLRGADRARARERPPQQLGNPGKENAALNYAYAVQWWLFAAAVPVGWAVLARREARERAAKAGEGTDAGAPGAARSESAAV